MSDIKVTLLEYPTEEEWFKVKQRALVTAGLKAITPPDEGWKRKMLECRHSPIRKIQFSFYIECPSWVSVHLVRHVHTQPYVLSQRNDRQEKYDRNKAPQDSPVQMIWDMNAEALINVANKRLCAKASKETREVVREMCRLVISKCPEFRDELVPMCDRENACHEMFPCGKRDS